MSKRHSRTNGCSRVTGAPDPDLGVLGQPRQRGVLGGGQEVRGRPVVEGHGAGRVVVLDRLDRRGVVRVRHLGRGEQRPRAGGEPDLAVLVERVVVGHRERALGSQQHPLERLARRLRPRQRHRRRLHRRRRGQGLHPVGRRGDLGGALVLADLAGHAHVVADLHGLRDRGAEDEDRVGRLVRPCVHGSAGAGGLQVEAVEPTGRVGRRHDSLGDDRLSRQRAGVTRALDLGDRPGRGRVGRRVRGATTGGRCSGRPGGEREVCGVVVGVGAGGVPLERRGGRRGRRGRLLEGVAGPVADDVEHGWVAGERAGRRRGQGARLVGQEDRAGGPAHRDGSADRRGRHRGPRRAGALADEEVALRRDGAGQRGHTAGVGGPARGAVLDRRAGQVDRLVRRVVELDVVALPRRRGGTSAAVHLGDDHLRRVGGRVGRGDRRQRDEARGEHHEQGQGRTN